MTVPSSIIQAYGTLAFVGRRWSARSCRESLLRRHVGVRWVTAATADTTTADTSGRRKQIQPVVIIGGGPSGLLMSNLLSLYQVPSILLEAQTVETKFRHPQAHFLNTRTMEILQHWMPETYLEVKKAMPPVEHWNTFRFTHDMTAEPLAEVVHPVDRPLRAEVDSNGVLCESDVATIDSPEAQHALSPCSVGHLAQHTFCKILYDAAVQNALAVEGTQLLYGTSVTRVGRPRDGGSIDQHQQLVVETAANGSFAASVVIAADGANSMTRQSQGIDMRGQEGLQHLINIHVTLPPEQAARLHRDNNHAMLYFVLNEAAVSTVVCHSVGEYIIQIPYFPPYQSLAQDFGPDKLPAMLQTIFGPSVTDWQVRSVKSWTMSSLIADQFYSENDNIALVGDAAHVFPPAGGFGMNSGLQDVHNLAWKLAWAIHSNHRLDDGDSDTIQTVLQSYGRERRPVSQQNAALSVRNYQRVLQVTKACYLNEQHPALLKRVLASSPLPLSAKRTIFQKLLQTALHPLSWLQQPNSMYAKHIQSSLRSVLRTGTGLPLLFPKFEVGFGYPSLASADKSEASSSNDWRQDTFMDIPKVQMGHLLPHVEVQVVSKAKAKDHHPNLQYLSINTISTSDLPAQVARDKLPTFVVLCVGESSLIVDHSIVDQICGAVSTKIGLPVVSVKLLKEDSVHGSSESNGLALSLSSESPVFHGPSGQQGGAYMILIRPDGHITGMATELVSREALEQQFCDEALASIVAM